MHSKSRRVSYTQLEILCEFLDNNRDLASAHNRSLHDKQQSQKKWNDVTLMLNSVDDGIDKNWRGWCKYWVDFKAKLKRRLAAVRASHSRSGGGPSTEQPLTEIEYKFLNILGENFGQGLTEVPVESSYIVQFSESVGSVDDVGTDSPRSDTKLSQSNSTVKSEDNIFPRVPPPAVFDAVTPSFNITRTPPTPAPQKFPSTLSTSEAAHIEEEPTPSPKRRRRRRGPPMTQEAARRALVQSSQMRAEASVRSSVALDNIARNMEAMRYSLLRIERRNPVHMAQFSHPRDADWGAGAQAPCPWGAACAKRDPRHWRDHSHPPGKQPPPPSGMRVVHRQGNVFYINANTVNFYDDHFEAEDSDGNSVDYDYEFD